MNMSVPSDNDSAPASVPVPMVPGVYFGLDESAYHADPSLGSGSIRKLAKCPIYYWVDSHMNPLREPDTETDALLFGRALHKLVLEGLSEFQRTYRCDPCLTDYPEALVTADDIKGALRAVGGKLTGAKAELVSRLIETDPGAVIWDVILADHAEACAKARCTSLKPDVFNRIVAGANSIAGDERIRLAFQGGRAEISIFWIEDGVPMKARLDYTRFGREGKKTLGIVTDLKSFANKFGRPPERAVINALVETRLDIQAAAYFDGIARIPEFVRNGQVYGADGISSEWISMLGSLPIEDWRFFWCFYEKEAPVTLLRSTRIGSAMIQGARMEVARAQQAYRDNMARFGTEWKFIDPMQDTEFSDSDLPKWLGAQS